MDMIVCVNIYFISLKGYYQWVRYLIYLVSSAPEKHQYQIFIHSQYEVLS